MAEEKITVGWLRDRITCDSVHRKKDGTFLFKRSFFYRHGGNSEKVAACISAQLTSVGVSHEVVGHEELWKAYPKISYWTVTVSLKR